MPWPPPGSLGGARPRIEGVGGGRVRIGVLGAGAVGGTLAALLERAGHEVDVTARG
ncbi:2-dehydropantoate 2-reductase N-terminal domain-containing protein, partial [Clavibacter michiganensis]|uniref:2-dehydropantoate 2-reductase N-terminal domain-containing protein n=1 Tax=Clavibacter michiganensis TaxID=28447 RepID=UPI00292D3F74